MVQVQLKAIKPLSRCQVLSLGQAAAEPPEGLEQQQLAHDCSF
jgi:hypothetical protein